MRTPVLLAATLAVFFMNGAGIAGERESHEPAPQGGAAASAAPSRAEVRAELQIWRQSGLAELTQLEVPPLTTREYQAAAARYEAMRRSPAFAARVRAIADGSAR